MKPIATRYDKYVLEYVLECLIVGERDIAMIIISYKFYFYINFN